MIDLDLVFIVRAFAMEFSSVLLQGPMCKQGKQTRINLQLLRD